MKKQKTNSVKERKALRIAEAILSLFVLALSLNTTAWLSFNINGNLMICSIFCVMTLSELVRFMLINKESKAERTICLIQTSLYMAAALTAVIIYQCQHSMLIVMFIYSLALIIGRVYFIFRKNKMILKVIGVLEALLLVYVVTKTTVDALSNPETKISSELFCFWLTGTIVVLQYLVRTIALSFRRVRFDILLKVASRSMAAEILSGLIILVLAFSLLLTSIEPGMTRYSDAIWYCFALVTTIGFGDITAVTVTGRVLSVILGIYGIIVVALITSIIVNFYSEINKEKTENNTQTPPSAKNNDDGTSKPES